MTTRIASACPRTLATKNAEDAEDIEIIFLDLPVVEA
jgi:hypothetical protein